MGDVQGEVRGLLEGAIAELDSERVRLEKALAALGTGTAPTKGPPAKRRRSGKRAPRGKRRDQFLAAVQAKPGITVSEVGKQIGVTPANALYPVGKQLVKEKIVKKKGAGYHPS